MNADSTEKCDGITIQTPCVNDMPHGVPSNLSMKYGVSIKIKNSNSIETYAEAITNKVGFHYLL